MGEAGQPLDEDPAAQVTPPRDGQAGAVHHGEPGEGGADATGGLDRVADRPGQVEAAQRADRAGDAEGRGRLALGRGQVGRLGGEDGRDHPVGGAVSGAGGGEQYPERAQEKRQALRADGGHHAEGAEPHENEAAPR